MPRDGRFIEVIGTYDPLAKPVAIQVKKERAEAWLAPALGRLAAFRLMLVYQRTAPAVGSVAVWDGSRRGDASTI